MARRLGRFELADGGTLFLDEVGDLPPDVQVKLLRVLQEREFERVGGTETVKVDVRVVSATHRDLEKLIADGDVPRGPLLPPQRVPDRAAAAARPRRATSPLLAEHFVQKYAPAVGKRVRGLDAGAVAALAGYAWPGNVRELENVIERALILARGTEITAADLEFTPPARRHAAGARVGAAGGDRGRPRGRRRPARCRSGCRSRSAPRSSPPSTRRRATSPTRRAPWASTARRCTTGCASTGSSTSADEGAPRRGRRPAHSGVGSAGTRMRPS